MTVHVIGAGLSGLATAWYLCEAGARVRLIEATRRAGGLIQTRHVPEGLVEEAAPALTWGAPAEALFGAAGVPPFFAIERSKRRYIFRDGRPTRWPLTPLETVTAAARFGRAWIGRQARPRASESVAAWGNRVLGSSTVTWLLAPALQGIYASPPEALSASAIFDKKRTKRGTLAAPPLGMRQLIDGLQNALYARGVTIEFGDPVKQLDRNVPTAICTDAPAAARLLALDAPVLATALSRIKMVSLVTVTAFFDPRADDVRGFGVLFPRSSGVEALGALFNADIFAARSALRSETWIYGDLVAAALPGNDVEALARVIADRAVLTGRSASPRAGYVTRQWNALPVYDAAVLEAAAALRQLPSWLAIVGNYLGRLGASSLIEGAAEAAVRLTAEARPAAEHARGSELISAGSD